jgi:SAM-dependent methyltransferase
MRPFPGGSVTAKDDRKRKKRKKGRKGKRRRKEMARKADRHDLYQRSVQEPEVDVELIDRAFRAENGRRALSLREDFCGTALISATWVKSRKDRTALGVDLDAPTLEWGLRHNLEPLGDAAARVTLLEKNVLDVTRPKVDVVCAFNFSYCVFHDRRDLLRYFRAARRSLTDDGVFFLDNHAGSDTLEAAWDERPFKKFTYIWEQKRVDGLTNRGVRKIHFRFRDGSMLKNAFRYDWRIWSLAELRDVAADAGFRRTDVFAEKLDDDGEPVTGLRRVGRYRHDVSWTPYLACWR